MFNWIDLDSVDLLYNLVHIYSSTVDRWVEFCTVNIPAIVPILQDSALHKGFPPLEGLRTLTHKIVHSMFVFMA